MSTFRSSALAAISLSLSIGLPFHARSQEAVRVALNFAEIVRLGRPANTIIIGNPGLVDATLSDSRTVVLNAKAAGTTNMIVLGDEGERIGNYTIRVEPPARELTIVYHGSQRQTFSCGQTCTPVLSVGDQTDYFQATQQQTEAREEAATAVPAN